MKHTPRRARPSVEALEARDVPALHPLVHPLVHPLIHPLALRPADAVPITPALVRSLYHVPPGLTGAGQTIAIVDAFDDPNLAASVNTFDAIFGLPALRPGQLTEASPFGVAATDPVTLAGWRAETDLDVEWAHALAPDANLIVDHSPSDADADFFATITYARYDQPAVSVVDVSAGESEIYATHAFDAALLPRAGQLTVVASGDDGGIFPDYPADNPHVLAVGGTSFDGRRESAWIGSGGGPSALYKHRRSPDVAALAENVLFADLDPAGNGLPSSGLLAGDGTSFACPMWGGVVALLDQARAGAGRAPLDAPQQVTAQHGRGLKDITRGASIWFNAGPGYDYATGFGTPNVARLAGRLA